MIRSTLTLVALIALPAQADEVPTAQWYMRNPDQLTLALRHCVKDNQPIETPECRPVVEGLYAYTTAVNLARLQAHMAADQAAREQRWREHPNELSEWLAMCAQMPQDERAQTTVHCPEAKRVLNEGGKR